VAEPSLGPLGPDDEMLGPLDDEAAVTSVAGDVMSLPLPDVDEPASIVGGVTTLGVTTSCGRLAGVDAEVVPASDEVPAACGPTSVSLCGTTVAFETIGAVALEIICAASYVAGGVALASPVESVAGAVDAVVGARSSGGAGGV